MLEWLLEMDRNAFIALNGAGSPHLDQLMIWVSDRYIWFPFYAYLLFRLYRQYGKKCYLPVLTLSLIIFCTDQVTSSLMKPYFERLRPCKDPLLEDLILVAGDCRGSFGFASGHAANAFGLAGFFFFLEKSRFTMILLVWASLVAYSRIYLGVHYPGDVVAGSLVGLTLSSAGVAILHRWFPWIKAYSHA